MFPCKSYMFRNFDAIRIQRRISALLPVIVKILQINLLEFISKEKSGGYSVYSYRRVVWQSNALLVTTIHSFVLREIGMGPKIYFAKMQFGRHLVKLGLWEEIRWNYFLSADPRRVYKPHLFYPHDNHCVCRRRTLKVFLLLKQGAKLHHHLLMSVWVPLK